MAFLRTLNCRTQGRGSYGFTLLEMLSVIIIISLLISLSIPSIAKTAHNFYFRNKAKQLQAYFLYLKRTAVLEERSYKWTVDPQENSFDIEAQEGEITESKYVKLKESFSNIRLFSSNISIKSGPEGLGKIEIVFQPDGSISGCEFYIYDNKHNEAKITTTLSGEIILEFI